MYYHLSSTLMVEITWMEIHKCIKWIKPKFSNVCTQFIVLI
jgi:hypothetical protein